MGIGWVFYMALDTGLGTHIDTHSAGNPCLVGDATPAEWILTLNFILCAH